MSTIKANDIQNASGGIPTVKSQQLIPTAWVNFNGTSTVAIRDSENVSSVTDNATGDYAINFAVAMANSDYAFAGHASSTAGSGTNSAFVGGVRGSSAYATTNFRFITKYNQDGGLSDVEEISGIVLGGQA